MMNYFPTQKEIIDAVIKGIETAKDNYSFWTSDPLFLSYAPAKFLSIHVAQEIGKLQYAPEIFMDATIEDILRCSLSSRDVFKQFMKENDIFQDVVSLTLDQRFSHQTDNDSVSKVIITLRNGVRNAHPYKIDIERMCKLLNRNHKEDSSLEYGIFGFYLDISSSARKKSEKRITDIVAAFDEVVEQFENLKSTYKGGKLVKIDHLGEWGVGCYIIEPTI